MIPETWVSVSSGLISSGAAIDKSITLNCGSLHYEYIKAASRWRLCRDVIEGEDVVRSRGTLYLPRPSGQDEAEYTAYSLRASFTNATGRAQDGLEGLIFRKKPAAILPKKITELATDITTTGLTLDELAKGITHEVLITGRGGLLVEFPTVAPNPNKVIADAEANGERPYLTYYSAEDILNWREARIRNKKQLSWVKLREWRETVDPNDPNQTAYTEILREIRLTDAGLCEQLEYEANKRDAGVVKTIIINNEQLDYIPFVFVGTIDTSTKVQKPPVYDIAIKNIHHFQLSADRRNAIHWADSPTPVVIGALVSTDGKPVEVVKLGSATVLNIATGGDAKYLEFMGNGLEPTKAQMNEDLAEMAILLSRILAGDSKAAEAAETAAIHRAGENAVLASIANAVSSAITKSLQIVAEWVKENTGTISYRLNTNFYPTPMTSQMLIALTNSLITGKGVTQEEFFDALVAGDVIRPDKTYDEHVDELAEMPKVDVAIGGALNAPGEADGKTRNGPSGEPGSGNAKIVE